MPYDDDDLEINEKLLGNFNLLCGLIQQKSGTEFNVDLTKLRNLIDKKIPDTLKKNAPEDFYDLYTEFRAEEDKFVSFVLYDRLIGKNIVALGGGFSSGKSSFLNRMLGSKVLPADTDPSTSVPAYIVNGQEHDVAGVNVFGAKVSMRPKDIRKIAHGFGVVRDDDDEKITDGVTLGHVMNNIFFSTPLQTYEHIAFLDTPGYSNPGDLKGYDAKKTDKEIARQQLSSSNYILWFVQADAGTITEEDIKFIQSLREDIPKLIIVNKAEKKILADLKEIIAKIKSSLELKGVRYVDVRAFSCKLNPDQIYDSNLMSFLESEAAAIKAQLDEWNRQVYESSFARNFKKIFVRCKRFYEEKIDEESRKLARLNTALTLLGSDTDHDIIEPLQLMVKDIKSNLDELREVSRKVKELQDEFFTEIKFISDKVGIAMPEPSEIDLLQDNAYNPLQLIDEYKSKHGIKTDPAVSQALQDILDGIRPTLKRDTAKSAVLEMLEDALTIDPAEIKIHDAYKSNHEYAELFRQLQDA